MSAIWRNDGSGWKLLAPAGFPDERALHTLVEQAPQILPLAGAPRLAVVGREVAIGSGFADLLAVEPSGRIAIIEVKLARNAEARRAVVAQVLAYAAYLTGSGADDFEQSLLIPHLRPRGFESLADAVREADQEGAFDSSRFATGLAESLAKGSFRLIFVLDEAPDELIRLVGYLQAISDKLLIDLVTVASYNIDQSMVLVPQRVDPEHRPVEQTSTPPPVSQTGQLTDGPGVFTASINYAAEQHRSTLLRLLAWAQSLENQGLANLSSYTGRGRWTLLPRLSTENVGLATIWNDNGAYLSLWRSVFERRAPKSLPLIEDLIAPGHLGQGTSTRRLDDELLQALTDAYQEASVGLVVASPGS